MVKYNRLEFIKWLNADETRKETLPDWSKNTEAENWDHLSTDFFNVDTWEERVKVTNPKLLPYREVFNKWKIEKDKATKEWEREIREEQKQKNSKETRENLLLLFLGLLCLFVIYWMIKKRTE